MMTLYYYLVHPLVLLVEEILYILSIIVAPFVHLARTVLYLASLLLQLRKLFEVSTEFELKNYSKHEYIHSGLIVAVYVPGYYLCKI